VKGGVVLGKLGQLALDIGDYPAARRFFGTFLIERSEIGERWGVCWGLQGPGAVTMLEQQPESAAQLFGASLSARNSILPPLFEAEAADFEVRKAALREFLDEERLYVSWQIGRSMDLEAAVRYALAGTFLHP
jgi:hypothetical protein